MGQTQYQTDGTTDPGTLVRQMCVQLRQLCYRRGDRLGVAVTGRVDNGGRWHAVNSETLSDIKGYPLATSIEEMIGPASIINDAAAAALAEHRLGSGRGHRNFVYVTVSTGVGGGLILNGQLHQSPNGLAGHFGFASGVGETRSCGSGRFGTVESIASGLPIAGAARALGHPKMDARAVFIEAQSGAKWANTLIDASACAISDLACDLSVLLGIDRVAIGGSIGLAGGYLERLRKHHSKLPEHFQSEIVTAKLGARGPLLGALLFDGNMTEN